MLYCICLCFLQNLSLNIGLLTIHACFHVKKKMYRKKNRGWTTSKIEKSTYQQLSFFTLLISDTLVRATIISSVNLTILSSWIKQFDKILSYLSTVLFLFKSSLAGCGWQPTENSPRRQKQSWEAHTQLGGAQCRVACARFESKHSIMEFVEFFQRYFGVNRNSDEAIKPYLF